MRRTKETTQITVIPTTTTSACGPPPEGLDLLSDVVFDVLIEALSGVCTDIVFGFLPDIAVDVLDGVNANIFADVMTVLLTCGTPAPVESFCC